MSDMRNMCFSLLFVLMNSFNYSYFNFVCLSIAVEYIQLCFQHGDNA